MPFTVKPDGSIVTDTVEEALQVRRLILGAEVERPTFTGGVDLGVIAGGVNLQTPQGRLGMPPPPRRVHVLPLPVREFLNKLGPYVDQTIGSEEMKEIVGTDSLTGVGPRLRSIKNELERIGSSLDYYLSPSKGADGITSWTVINSKFQREVP